MNAMNYHGIWLAGLTILSIISYRRISPYRFTSFCYIDNSVEGLKTLNCSTLNPTQVFTSVSLPEGGEKNKLQVIYIAPIDSDIKIAVDIMAINYRDYPNLKRIIISRNAVITLTTQVDFKRTYTIFYRHNLEQIFDDCENLEMLEISYSYFYDVIQFKLPRNLKIYNAAGNLYNVMRIAGSDELVELNANDNPLINIPLVTKTNPPLKTLRLKRCPLQDMTIIDLAPLCDLTLLELDFPSDNRMVNSEGYCNCTILLDWAKETELKIDSVKCYEPKNTEKITCPSSQYLNNAREIRKKRCPLLKKGTVTRIIVSVLLYVFFSILLLMLLATLILFIIRHYHLKEWWRQHYLNKSSSITMEEAEETLKSQSSEER